MRTKLSARVATPFKRPHPKASTAPGHPATRDDARWTRLAETLAELRLQGRHAIRIVDADCGRGALLLEAVRHARALGFVAIEGRGIDGSPALIARARAAAARIHDPAIGISFDNDDMRTALTAETECPADIVLWRGTGAGTWSCDIPTILHAAANVVIGDPGERGPASASA